MKLKSNGLFFFVCLAKMERLLSISLMQFYNKKVKGNIKHKAVRKKGHRNINAAAKECAEREATIVRKSCSINRGLLSKEMTPTQISFQLLKVRLRSFHSSKVTE